MSSVSLYLCSTLVFETEFFKEVGAHPFSQTVWPEGSGILLFLPLQDQDCRYTYHPVQDYRYTHHPLQDYRFTYYPVQDYRYTYHPIQHLMWVLAIQLRPSSLYGKHISTGPLSLPQKLTYKTKSDCSLTVTIQNEPSPPTEMTLYVCCCFGACL